MDSTQGHSVDVNAWLGIAIIQPRFTFLTWDTVAFSSTVGAINL